MIVGECMHLINSFICTEGKHQNYPCPYRDNATKCSCSILVTEKMAEQWNNHGCVVISKKGSI